MAGHGADAPGRRFGARPRRSIWRWWTWHSRAIRDPSSVRRRHSDRRGRRAVPVVVFAGSVSSADQIVGARRCRAWRVYQRARRNAADSAGARAAPVSGQLQPPHERARHGVAADLISRRPDDCRRADTRDVGRGGIGIRTMQPLPGGTPLQLTLQASWRVARIFRRRPGDLERSPRRDGRAVRDADRQRAAIARGVCQGVNRVRAYMSGGNQARPPLYVATAAGCWPSRAATRRCRRGSAIHSVARPNAASTDERELESRARSPTFCGC